MLQGEAEGLGLLRAAMLLANWAAVTHLSYGSLVVWPEVLRCNVHAHLVCSLVAYV